MRLKDTYYDRALNLGEKLLSITTVVSQLVEIERAEPIGIISVVALEESQPMKIKFSHSLLLLVGIERVKPIYTYYLIGGARRSTANRRRMLSLSFSYWWE